MVGLDPADFHRSLRKLGDIKLKNLLFALGWPEDRVAADRALPLWLVDHLLTFAPLDDDHVTLILRTFAGVLTDYAGKLAQAIEHGAESLPVGHLMLADRRYAAVSGHLGFLDLRSGDKLEALPRAPVEIIHYNLCEIDAGYRRRMTQAGKEPP